jgi:hypothetical protein
LSWCKDKCSTAKLDHRFYGLGGFSRIKFKMDNEKLLLEDITDEIINAFYLVYNELGFGFLENSVSKFNVLRITFKRV